MNVFRKWFSESSTLFCAAAFRSFETTPGVRATGTAKLAQAFKHPSNQNYSDESPRPPKKWWGLCMS